MSESTADAVITLAYARLDLDKIKEAHAESLNEDRASYPLRMSIRNFLGNISSTLDYLAFDVFNDRCTQNLSETEIEKAQTRVYFPIYKSKHGFDKGVAKMFPGLVESDHEIVSIFESVQRYKAGDQAMWSEQLKTLNNENKHRIMTKQLKREVVRANNITFSSGGSTVSFINCDFVLDEGSAILAHNGQTIKNNTLKNHPNTRVFDAQVQNQFFFKDINSPVLTTLENICKGAADVTQRLVHYMEETRKRPE